MLDNKNDNTLFELRIKCDRARGSMKERERKKLSVSGYTTMRVVVVRNLIGYDCMLETLTI